MHELMPDVLERRIEPGLVFDRITEIDGVPDRYRAMNEREVIKVMIEF
jgi:threonine dehydrogenase-like Zn-dependent dehydrogenase